MHHPPNEIGLKMHKTPWRGEIYAPEYRMRSKVRGSGKGTKPVANLRVYRKALCVGIVVAVPLRLQKIAVN